MEGLRTITACFAPVPRRCMSRPYMHFLLMFHEVRQISKTRNPLMGSASCGRVIRNTAQSPATRQGWLR